MAPSLNCLFVENSKRMYDSIKENLEVYWSQICDRPIEFRYVGRVEDALRTFTSRPSDFQIVISDIFFPPAINPRAKLADQDTRGFEVIAAASRLAVKPVIVGLSQGSRQKPSLADQAKDHGADIFLFHAQLTADFGFEDLCRQIKAKLHEKGHLQHQTETDWDENHHALQYLMSSITEETVKALVVKVLNTDRIEKIDVSYVAPGASGAIPLRIRVHRPTKVVEGFLLKVSKDRDRLKRELANVPLSEYGSRLIVKYLQPNDASPAEANGWSAIASVFEDDAVTFQAWLHTQPSPQEVDSVLALLFKDGLSKAYSGTRTQAAVISFLTRHLSRVARISEAVEKLHDVISDPELGGIPDWTAQEKIVKMFLKGHLGSSDVQDLPNEYYQCQCHGDLHCRNVLVTTTSPPGPLIIDAAEFGLYHWATDYARFAVDILLSSYDLGSDAYKWNYLSNWRKVANQLINLEPLEADDDHAASRAALNYLIKNVSLVCPQMSDAMINRHKWELQLVLAMEFLRGSYRTEVTDPKKVLGIVACHDALQAAQAWRLLHPGN